MREHVLRAVVYFEAGWWIAQLLEHDLATAARSLEDLPSEIERFLKVQIVGSREAGIEPFQDLPRAPERFWRMYEHPAGAVRHEQLRINLPGELDANASVDALIAA